MLLSHGPPAALQRQIEVEQLRMVWEHVRAALLVATAFAVVLAVALRGVVAPVLMVDAWLAVKVTVSIFRALQGWRFARQAVPGHRWMHYTLASLMLDSAAWGVAGFYVVLTAPWPLASFISAVMACLACVATFGLQVSARFTAGYVVPILLPAISGLLMRNELFGQLGGLGMLMLLGLQLTTASRSQRRVEESIQLRVQAEALALEKAEALKTAMRQGAVRTQFLANISHELRTPLHGILGMARLLQAALDEPAQRQRADLIASSGAHLLSLINDLLDLSRIDAGQFVIRKERHDLSAQVAQLASIYTMRCDEKGLRFKVENDLPPACWVMGDPARYRQVLHNLLGNAVKFTQHGEIRLHITRDVATGVVRAEIHDTGPGIPPADLDKIFEAFHQAEPGHASQSGEGAGLGLTIARDIARAMAGDIVATSVPGLGTIMAFTACLPDAQAPAAPADSERAAPPNDQDARPSDAVRAAVAFAASTAPAPPLTASAAANGQAQPVPARPCQVLLAEDNDINALVATNFLELIGVEAERVKDGQEAVREALRDGTPERPRPDLVLMDCHMPVMTGHEAARVIRTREQALGLGRIPIVALTATASDTERQDCLDAGMDDFLSKPCTLEDLARAIARWSATPPARSLAQTPGNVVGIMPAAPGSQPATGPASGAPLMDGSSATSPGASLRA